MPAARGALAALGKGAPTGYSNSTVANEPALLPLTDLFAMPRWLPFANVFSIGDVAIGLGVVTVIVVAMRTARSRPQPAEPATPALPPAGGPVRPGNSPS
jgi:hypothetical protein